MILQRVSIPALALAAGLAVPSIARSTAAVSDPPLTIVQPAADTAVVGDVAIELALAPSAAPPSLVVIMADGREVCRLPQPPWRCRWDAGQEPREHHLRAVATFPDGRRSVANRRTRGLDVNERVDVAAVQVPVVVTDARGRYVPGLRRDAFTLVENGVRQRIDSVIDASLPLELVVTIDISASMTKAMPDVQAAVKRLLARLRPEDTTTLLGFNETIFVLAERESDPALRDAAVDALVPWGGTAFYDATVRSLALAGNRTGRRGVIVFSDGDDRHSVGRRDASLQRIEEGQVALYTVGFGQGASAEFRETLRTFAETSGGRAWFPQHPEDVDAAFAAIFDDLSHQYILSYVSSVPPDGGWRRLEIRACPGCQVRAREGYRAIEP